MPISNTSSLSVLRELDLSSEILSGGKKKKEKEWIFVRDISPVFH